MDDFFDNLRQTLSETAEAVGKKTEELVETQKLRSRIHTAQRNVDQDYRKLGHMVFQRFVEGEAMDQELSAICDNILEIQAQIARYQEALAKKRGQNICPACGKASPAGASFCMFCGTEMPAPEDEGPHFEEETEWSGSFGSGGNGDTAGVREEDLNREPGTGKQTAEEDSAEKAAELEREDEAAEAEAAMEQLQNAARESGTSSVSGETGTEQTPEPEKTEPAGEERK